MTGVRVSITVDDNAVYTSSEVAKHLQLSSGMVRRYHLSLERVIGLELPRDPKTNGRLVTADQLAALTEARRRVQVDSRLSVEEALGQLYGTVTDAPDLEPILPPNDGLKELLERVLEELADVKAEVSELRGENRELRALTDSQEEIRAEANRFKKMNGYLLGELERRRLTAEKEADLSWWQQIFRMMANDQTGNNQ